MGVTDPEPAVFDEPGISPDDLDWVERDEFIYYLELHHQLDDPDNWPGYKTGLLDTLHATIAHGISDAGPGSRDEGTLHEDLVATLEAIRSRHSPVRDWPAFRRELWKACTPPAPMPTARAEDS